TSWTIDRPGTSTTYRVTAYGDSIYAGYHGSISNVAKRAAPWVDGEYLSQLWSADIEVIRRAKSGAVASDIYNNKIVAERSYMQTTNTRVVSFEVCGHDGLPARGIRHTQQQDHRRALPHTDHEHARRELRDVRQRRPPGAQQLLRPERHLRLQRARHRARQLHDVHAAGDAVHQSERLLRDEAEG